MEELLQSLIAKVRAEGRVEVVLSADDCRRLRARFYNYRRMRRMVKDTSTDGIVLRMMPNSIIFLHGSELTQRLAAAVEVA